MPIVTVFELARSKPHVGFDIVTGADSSSVHQLVSGAFTRHWALSLVLALTSEFFFFLVYNFSVVLVYLRPHAWHTSITQFYLVSVDEGVQQRTLWEVLVDQV